MNKHALAIMAGWLFSMWLATAEAACNPDDMQGRWRFYFSTIANQSFKCALLLTRNPDRDFTENGRRQYFLEAAGPNITNCDGGEDTGLLWVQQGSFIISNNCVWSGAYRTTVELYSIPNAVMANDGLTIYGRLVNRGNGTRSAFSGAKE